MKKSWEDEQYLSNLSGTNKQLILAQKHIRLSLCTKIQYWGEKVVLQTNLKEMTIWNTEAPLQISISIVLVRTSYKILKDFSQIHR